MSDKREYIRFDWAIKRILRDKANKEVLEGLIQVLIKEPVTITEILESENNKDRRDDKGNRVDVKAMTEKGEIIIVEVQLTKERDFFQRILFGSVTAINDQIGTGQNYEVIKKVYSVNILYFNFGSGDDYAFHGVTTFRGMTNENAVLEFNNKNERRYMDSERRRMTSPDEVFPEYFLLIVDRFNEVARTPIEEWMAYLKDGAIREDTTVPGLQEARRKLEYMSMTDEERREYRDYMVSVHAAKDAIETAKEEGRAEGREEGEQTKAIDTARKMKADGMPTELIAKYSGLTAEEIERL
jgi:predicted transposase/invertase (TIGR01784 family)